MQEEEHKKLLRDVEELRELIGGCSTQAIVGSYAVHTLNRANSAELGHDLISPAKQWAFLLGVMLTSAEPVQPSEFGEAEFARAVELLNTIFKSYAWTFFPGAGEEVTNDWRRVREVAMPAFLDYFNQTMMATTQQIEQRILRYLAPFDEILKEELGLDATNAVTICRWLTDQLQSSLDELADFAARERRERYSLLNRGEREQWSHERLRLETQCSNYESVVKPYLSELDKLFFITLSDLRNQFGPELADPFWSLFSVGRGDIKSLTYPTEANVAEERSLYRIVDDRAMCPVANGLFSAVLSRFENHLSAGPHRDIFFRKRDRILEEEVASLLSTILAPRGKRYASLYETPDQQFEHDLIAIVGSVAFVVEAKASPPIEPFRDPDRAFTRIQQRFQSNRGIQHAFDQGNRIWTRWHSGEVITLYDRHGQIACQFDSKSVHEIFLLCATRDNFATLAVDLSLLLEKEENSPYPWAVNVLDLEAIADAWDYFGWDDSKFIEFLRQRARLHGRVICSDELDVAGFFIKHGDLNWISGSDADRVQITPDYSSVFDRIYFARQGGAAVPYNPTEPCMADIVASLREGRLIPVNPRTKPSVRKQRRNDLCACGSGIKFKRCCGR